MSDSPKGFSPTRLRRLHDAMTARVERGEIPGLVMALWRHGETSIDAIGVQNRDTGAPRYHFPHRLPVQAHHRRGRDVPHRGGPPSTTDGIAGSEKRPDR